MAFGRELLVWPIPGSGIYDNSLNSQSAIQQQSIVLITIPHVAHFGFLSFPGSLSEREILSSIRLDIEGIWICETD